MDRNRTQGPSILKNRQAVQTPILASTNDDRKHNQRWKKKKKERERERERERGGEREKRGYG